MSLLFSLIATAALEPVVWRVFRWFHVKGDSSTCPHPPSVNPVSCHGKSTWFMLTRKQAPQGACNVMILVNMYTYIFNSLITCILFVFPFCSSGWNEALASHNLQSTAIMNWFLYSLTGRLTLISVLHVIPGDKTILYWDCFYSVCVLGLCSPFSRRFALKMMKFFFPFRFIICLFLIVACKCHCIYCIFVKKIIQRFVCYKLNWRLTLWCASPPTTKVNM